MNLDLVTASEPGGLHLPEWSAAEVLDTAFSDELKLRAIVFRLDAQNWQWSVTSLDRDRGELISSGVEKTAAAARAMAAVEIAKCLEAPLA